jgi:hypothetical protein
MENIKEEENINYIKFLKGFDDAVSYCVVMGLWTLSIVRRVKFFNISNILLFGRWINSINPSPHIKFLVIQVYSLFTLFIPCIVDNSITQYPANTIHSVVSRYFTIHCHIEDCYMFRSLMGSSSGI